jgi:hypothetical protein
MQKLNFKINIEASKERVWQILWDDETYRQWTTAFCEGTYAVSDWKEGSKIHFLSPSGDGMFGIIEKITENEFISFKHLGELKNHIEQPNSEFTEKWSGCHENYTLNEENSVTNVSVDLDSMEEYVGFFNEKFPNALQNIKNLAEQKVKTVSQ